MQRSNPVIFQRKDKGSLNHGGWFRLEGKQFACYAREGRCRVTEASGKAFWFLDISREEISWLSSRFLAARRNIWRWSDCSHGVYRGRLFAVDCANSEGRFLRVWRMGLRSSVSIRIPFDKGGLGWALFEELISKEGIFNASNLNCALTIQKQRTWAEDALIIVRGHTSKLSWDKVAKATSLEVLPFSDTKAMVFTGSREMSRNLMAKRWEVIEGERVYYNKWHPLCNRIVLGKAAWFRVFGLPFTEWSEETGKLIAAEMGVLVECCANSLKRKDLMGFRIKVIPKASMWAGGKVLCNARGKFGDVFAVREVDVAASGGFSGKEEEVNCFLLHFSQ